DNEPGGASGALPAAQGVGAHLLRVIQGQPVLRVGIREPHLPTKRQGIPQRSVGLQGQHGVVELFGQAEEFLPQLTRPLVLPSRMIAIPQPPQRRKKLRRLARLCRRRAVRSFLHLPSKLAGPDIDAFYLWGHGAPDTPQRRAERELQRQFLLGTLASLGESLEYF